MTVGEKIQFYRKKIGLSQEELGQKMLVSRQTISLWEMDKTLPTVDNLLRLKEVFAVSVDDLLSESCPTEPSKEEPKETYIFRYSRSDLREVFAKIRLPMIKRTAVFIVACIVLVILLAAAEAPDALIGLAMGCFLIGIISHIKGYLLYIKNRRSSESRILESTYLYEIYENYFVLTVSRNEEMIRTLKIYFDDIEKIQSFGRYMVLQISGQGYIIKKDVLRADSAFVSLCDRMPEKTVKNEPKGFLKTGSLLLCILSIVTIFGALIGVAILSESNQAHTENMWVFFLFLPIPIASILFGFYLKKREYKYKKNVVIGFIMALLLSIYGSFAFLFADVYSHSDELLLRVEETLSIDIPDYTQINTQDWTKGTQSMPRGYVYYTGDVYFDESAVEEFEKNLPNDTRWISDIPSNMIGITSYFCDIQKSDYYIIYNTDTKEFNKLPSESGTYGFINVLYNKENHCMTLVEYQIEYTK